MLALVGLFSALLFAAGATAEDQTPAAFLCTAFTNATADNGAPGIQLEMAMKNIPVDVFDDICDPLVDNWSYSDDHGDDSHPFNCYQDKKRGYATIGVNVLSSHDDDAQREALELLTFVNSQWIMPQLAMQNFANATASGCNVVEFFASQFAENEDRTDNFTVYPGETLHFSNQDVVVQSVSLTAGSVSLQLPDRDTILQNLGDSVNQLSGTGRTIGTSDAPVTEDQSVWLKVLYDTRYKTKHTTNIAITKDEWLDFLGKLVNTLTASSNGETCIAVSATNKAHSDGRDIDLMIQACFTH